MSQKSFYYGNRGNSFFSFNVLLLPNLFYKSLMKKIVIFFLLAIAVPSFAQQNSVFLQNPILSAQNESAFEIPPGFFSGSETAQWDPTLNDRIIAAMNSTYTKDRAVARHGIAYSVLIPGHPQWSGAIGLNDDVNPMSADLAFEIASNTKTFVAALIMKLEEEGKLSIKDSIGKWLPRKYPNVDGAITIEQMLNHSSGLYDFLNDDPNFEVFADFYNYPSRRWTPDQILDTFVGVPNFKPGTSYRYCNTNFLLAGIVAESAGGATLGSMIHKYFIDPLKLMHTYFGGEDSITIPFAHNWYQADANSSGPDFYPLDKTGVLSGAWAAGNIVSTPDDLVQWGNALYTGKVVSKQSLAKMMAVHQWPDGSYYGLGTARAPYNTRYVYGHGGSLLGFKSAMWTNVADSVSIVVYMNSDPNNALHDKTVNDYVLDVLNEIYRKVNGVALNDNISGVPVSVYPNPASDNISFTFRTKKTGIVKLSLYNELGQSVASLLDESLPPGIHTSHAEINDLHAGTYFYSLQTGDGVMRGKIFVK